jgi:hypothetical protein
MNWQALLVLPFLANFAAAQSEKMQAPPKVEKICGKLQRETPVRVSPLAKTNLLFGVPLGLYVAEGDRPCCEAMTLAGTTKSGTWASFHFKAKNLKPGMYWLVAKTNDREYKILIQYEPKKNSEQSCGDTWWQVNNDGKFEKLEVITVD